MSSARAVVTAAIFVWLGMVLAISFLEAPIKFRAPGVTLRIGLGIGRLVFRALNTVEALFGAAIIIACIFDTPAVCVVAPAAIAIGALTSQVTLVRPALTRRSNAVLTGSDAPPSHAHHAYIGLEIVKTVGLLAAGVLSLATTHLC